MRDSAIAPASSGLRPCGGGFASLQSLTQKERSKSLNQEAKRLDIYLVFISGSEFPCPVCGQECGAYDTSESRWQHLNFFQYYTYIHVWNPWTKCKEDGIKQIEVPWARERSGFTLWFEAMIMTLADTMPVKRIAEIVGILDTRI